MIEAPRAGVIDLSADAVTVPERHAPIVDGEGAHISPSPLLVMAMKMGRPIEILRAIDVLKSRKACKRLWIAEAAGTNRAWVLDRVTRRAGHLPEAPESALRFFDGARMRESLTEAERERLHYVQI